ncbi:hypothetical protein T12_13961 [Trichinella patagoniensis]|uniref:Uncharacterized protein n=1 Tax=Trichinella patagoniensis TaxID=990121 RepID=A0A0V1A1G2_9BILA|nr:hypothetical protein T12_13961 [Trichinella patagoniensis]
MFGEDLYHCNYCNITGHEGIKSRKNFCLLNVRNSSHSRTCLPENVCKFLFHCYACVYVALMSMIAGLRHLHLYERECKELQSNDVL